MLSPQDSITLQKAARVTRYERRRLLFRRMVPYLLLAPALLILFALLVYPLVVTIFMSFTRWSLTDPGPAQVVGLENYVRLFTRDPAFRDSLWFTLRFTAVTIGLEFVIGLACAVLLDQVKFLRSIFTSIAILPYMVASIAAGLIWRLLWSHDYGLVNFLLGLFGLEPVTWLGQSTPAFWAAVITETWKSTPFVTLVLLAGLTSIPHEIIEAARIDGASAWQAFRRVVFPLLAPAATVALILQTVFKLRVFDIIFTLTGGGPGRDTTPLGLLIQKTYFRFFEGGYSSAIAVVLLLLGAVISVAYIRLLYREVEH